MGDTYGDRILSSNTGLDLSIAAKVLADFQMLDNLPVHTGCLDVGVMEKLVGASFAQYRRQDNILQVLRKAPLLYEVSKTSIRPGPLNAETTIGLCRPTVEYKIFDSSIYILYMFIIILCALHCTLSVVRPLFPACSFANIDTYRGMQHSAKHVYFAST